MQTAVTVYLSSMQLLLFAIKREICLFAMVAEF